MKKKKRILWVHQSQGCLIFTVLFSWTNSFLIDSSRCDGGCPPGILEIKAKLAEGNQVESCLSLLSTVCTIHTTKILHNVLFMNFETDRLFPMAHCMEMTPFTFFPLSPRIKAKTRGTVSQILKKKAINVFNVLNFEPLLSCCSVHLEHPPLLFFFFLIPE